MLCLIVILANLVTPWLVSASCSSPEHVAVSRNISEVSFGNLLTEIYDHLDDLAQPAMAGTPQWQPVVFLLNDSSSRRLSCILPSLLRPPIDG